MSSVLYQIIVWAAGADHVTRLDAITWGKFYDFKTFLQKTVFDKFFALY
jgi:hypothetical protein